MSRFIGRQRELTVLTSALARVAAAPDDAVQTGECILIRGRRRIGKSSLVEEFLRKADTPFVYFTAAGISTTAELAELKESVARSDLPDREVYAAESPRDWSAAVRLLADVVPTDRPSVIVIDEVPYLMATEGFEGVLQRTWDRWLRHKPVLFLLVGSDLSMMEALNSYDRPFHQRGKELVLGSLTPADLADMLALAPADAIDAALVTGGLPLICAEWPPGADLWVYLSEALADPVSALLVSAERTLAAEFPPTAMAREVLTAIGSGERSFSNIARAAGGISHSTLSRAVTLLQDKRVVVGELPLSQRPSKDRRYRVADPYLRFWLTFLGPRLAEIERMRGDITLDRVREQWTAWRGRAVEPLVRDSLARLLPVGPLPASPEIGSYWTRSNDVEIDLVGADRGPVAQRIDFVGSIKWLEQRPFDRHDLASLLKHRERLTDVDVPLVAVTRSGSRTDGIDAVVGPDELVAAWRRT